MKYRSKHYNILGNNQSIYKSTNIYRSQLKKYGCKSKGITFPISLASLGHSVSQVVDHEPLNRPSQGLTLRQQREVTAQRRAEACGIFHFLTPM